MESSLLLKCFFWVSLLGLLFQFQSCLGCFEEERFALLEFKAQLNRIDPNDQGFRLSSWADEKGSDCCSWELVKCNATTGRIIQLSLSWMWPDFYSGDTWYLNATLFSAFEELQHLNLSYNYFDGCIKNEGFERLVGLRKLEVLDLSHNLFDNNILPSLGTLTSLRILSLSGNNLEGSVHLEGFERLVGLRKLEVLDLSFNFFNSSILPSLGVLMSLRVLSLSGNELEGSAHLEDLAILHNLQTLDLSYNRLQLASTQTNQGFYSLVRLKKLEFLNLHSNNFDDNIFLPLSRLTSLRTLSLGFNNFSEGSTHLEELANLHNLQSLDLSDNSMNASLRTIQGFNKLVGLKRLEALDLSHNNFNNSIVSSLVALTSITKLSLAYNLFEGSSIIGELANMHNLISLDISYNALNSSYQTIEALCQLKSLQELDLSWNNFEGILPQCLQNLTSLRVLDLSHNQFKGSIPTSLFTSWTSLTHLSLSFNDFEDKFSFNAFTNNSQLEMIDLSSGGNRLEVETDYPLWVLPFQLKVLLLSRCNLSQNAFPTFLSNQHQLREVDLSHNNLKGKFPTWLLENIRTLTVLKLKNNTLTGHFTLPSYIHRNLRGIDISNNCIVGLLHENIGNKFPKLEYLNVSYNCFEGGIPSSIGHIKPLFVLDMSNNNFTGELPDHMLRGCIRLSLLKLSSNRLHGQLFPPHLNWTWITSLHLDNNLFSGEIMNGLSKYSELTVLDIGNNKIIGRIPSWIGNFTYLEVLNMRGNHLEGNIPIEFQNLDHLFFVDLSYNHLSGSIPLNSTSLKHLHLQGNGFTGSPPNALINISNLLVLDMRYNDLHGGIPDWIGSLSNLKILLLRGNHLHGPLPNYMCQLIRISLMDLSQNALFGSIPRCFNNITFGRTQDADPLFDNYIVMEFGTSGDTFLEFSKTEEIVFVTKNRSDSYKGDILNFMSGLDLSCNHLSGEIPHEIGDLSNILALNLSYNELTGSIPKSVSNLTQIESLDLSHNKLSKEIPSELTTLYNLEVFTVAYNNLSGKTPERKAQFATFESNTYEGNPFLCGPPLLKDCSSSVESTNSSNGVKKDDEIDMGTFYASFVASYVVSLLGFVGVLYINPYWRRAWFYFIEECIHSCHDFVSDTWYKLSIHVLN